MVTMVTSQEGPEEKWQMHILGCGNGDENGCPYENILCLEAWKVSKPCCNVISVEERVISKKENDFYEKFTEEEIIVFIRSFCFYEDYKGRMRKRLDLNA